MVWAPGAVAQSQSDASALSGVGYTPQGVMGGGMQGGIGILPVPMYISAGTQQGTAASAANARLMNSMALNPMVGPVIPMTNAQAGLLLLSTQQRMLGLGNGQLSGVRPGGPNASGRQTRGSNGANLTAAHTRNSNIPGGQAARYFNRGTTTASRSEPFFKRQSQYFPQRTQ